MRTLSGWTAALLLLLATGVWASETPHAAPPRPGHCPSVSPASSSGALFTNQQSFLATLKPRSASLTDDCLPANQSCFYYGSGDCLDCWDDFGHRGTSICDSWLCAPSGALYTCCSPCSPFSC